LSSLSIPPDALLWRDFYFPSPFWILDRFIDAWGKLKDTGDYFMLSARRQILGVFILSEGGI
jgi:hypothetical protein